MRNKMLIFANMKRHKGTMAGIFMIMLIVSLSLVSVLTIWLNTNTYLQQEMTRMQFGDITAWTHDVNDQDPLLDEIKSLDDVSQVETQNLIYADYQIHDTESDTEGQLIVYEPEQFPYKIYNMNNNGYKKEATTIQIGEIYISPSIASSFDITVGDNISFMIGRQQNSKSFKVMGTFEDPFMGSSMIGMKSFLISQGDYDTVNHMIQQLDIDALARSGQMYHIQQSEQCNLSNAQFNQLLNEQTSLENYTEFVHSREAIIGFMLILQNVFTGLFLIFSLLLLIVSMIIVGYSITASIEQDQKNIAILKTIGYDGNNISKIVGTQYVMIIFIGLLSGLLLSFASIPFISKVMISFAGIMTPVSPNFVLWIMILCICILLFISFIYIKTKRIHRLPPINMLQNEVDLGHMKRILKRTHLQKHWLVLRISIRQVLSGKKRYISVGITAILLVFFTSMIGRMDSWLGPDGKGMMDAFNPADLDIGVQLLGNHSVEDMEAAIQQYTDVTDSYALAMPSVVVEGVDYTANVITEPQRFHIQQGTTIQSANEVVITETIANDRNLKVNDSITISNNGKSESYQIAGVYQCANDMGSNIGMSREGFLRIGSETSDMWCHHYFLDDTLKKQTIIDTLNATYGGDVYIHENTWPGLFSIIAAMKALLIIMYVVTAIFVFIVTILTGNKIFLYEKRNLAIYKTLGFTTIQLRGTFAIRYGLVALIGSLIGIFMSSLFTDQLVALLMKNYGISNFASHPGFLAILLPCLFICLLFMVFAYRLSVKIKKLEINELVIE